MLLMSLSCSPCCYSIIRCRVRLAFDERALKAVKARLRNIGRTLSGLLSRNWSREWAFLVVLICSRLELGFEEGFEKKRERVLNKIFTIFFLLLYQKVFLFRDEKFRCFGLLWVHKFQREKAAVEKNESQLFNYARDLRNVLLTAIRLLPVLLNSRQ